MKCKKMVSHFRGLLREQCKRNAVKDGYCKQHHPIEVKKRAEQREKRHMATPFGMI
jgi:hypothetical protein